MFAELCVKKAGQASESSLSSSSNLKVKLREKIESLDELVTQIDGLFNTYH